MKVKHNNDFTHQLESAKLNGHVARIVWNGPFLQAHTHAQTHRSIQMEFPHSVPPPPPPPQTFGVYPPSPHACTHTHTHTHTFSWQICIESTLLESAKLHHWQTNLSSSLLKASHKAAQSWKITPTPAVKQIPVPKHTHTHIHTHTHTHTHLFLYLYSPISQRQTHYEHINTPLLINMCTHTQTAAKKRKQNVCRHVCARMQGHTHLLSPRCPIQQNEKKQPKQNIK